MLEVLKFTCESLGRFIAVCALIGWIAFCLGCLIVAFGFALDNYKPNKH